MRLIAIYISLLLLAVTQPMLAQVAATEAMPVQATDTLASDTALTFAFDSVPPVVLVYPQILLDMPNVHVEQDSLITLLMEEKTAGVERGEMERAGYRVQVYSSNNPQRGKTEALLIEQRVTQAMNVAVYVIYASPSWKVRLGDFLDEQQAAEFRDVFKGLFPDLADYTYIVRDQVKVK